MSSPLVPYEPLVWFDENNPLRPPQPSDPYLDAETLNAKEELLSNLVGKVIELEEEPSSDNARDAEVLLGWVYSQSFRLVSATRDSNGAIITASIVWPDYSTGVFTTDTASTSFPGAIDAYHVTFVPGSGTVKTITQSAVTRDFNGAVTAQPTLVVS